ncbi:hypothetical protein [Spirosoma flavum]|uniref:Uncharacterized protein n=1 Tax=Spirosoma flavum TaxID=2048557 RepID=A0ABW6ASF8_9BACT
MARLTSMFALLGCSLTAKNQVVRGPMAISYGLERDYRLNLFTNNNNGKLIGSHTTSYVNLNDQGKRVVVTTSAGKKAPIWQARFLTDAPRTAMLASSNSVAG